MSEPEDDLEELSSDQVLEYLSKVTRRLAEDFKAQGLLVGTETLYEMLCSDEGATLLLAGAFEEGRVDAARSMLGGGGRVAVDWSDVESVGERRLIAKEDTACSRCSHARVCATPKTVPEASLVVISRCSDFAPI